MYDFAAVTSAARSRGSPDDMGRTIDAFGIGVGGGTASATEYADAQATHIETTADVKPLGKTILMIAGQEA